MAKHDAQPDCEAHLYVKNLVKGLSALGRLDLHNLPSPLGLRVTWPARVGVFLELELSRERRRGDASVFCGGRAARGRTWGGRGGGGGSAPAIRRSRRGKLVWPRPG